MKAVHNSSKAAKLSSIGASVISRGQGNITSKFIVCKENVISPSLPIAVLVKFEIYY